MPACRETSCNAWIECALLRKNIFSRDFQCRLRCFDVRISFERALDQIIERFGMKQRPPLAGNVDVAEMLRFAAGGVDSTVSGRERTGCVTVDGRSRRLFEIRAYRTAGYQQQGWDYDPTSDG